jgi:hypothetical protein
MDGMTIFDTRAATKVSPAEILWTTPDANLWVATVDSDYAGMIEFDDGHFVVRGMTNNTVATCATIPAAKDAFAKYVHSRSLPAAVRLLSTLATADPRSPFLDRRPRPGYARGKVQHG